MSTLVNAYQTCPICGAKPKVMFKDAGDTTLLFEPHYEPGTTRQCVQSGKPCVLPQVSATDSTTTIMASKNTAKKKCKRCWQMIRVTKRGSTYVLHEHNGVSGRARCAGSEEAVSLP